MEGSAFRSPDELREVLDHLLISLDTDPVAGPAMRSSGVPHRFVYPDAETSLDVNQSETPDHCLSWTFDEDPSIRPALSFEMTSGIANRFMQGRENLAIAMARGRITVSCPRAKSALSFLPTSRMMITHYQRLIEREYPHLIITG